MLLYERREFEIYLIQVKPQNLNCSYGSAYILNWDKILA